METSDNEECLICYQELIDNLKTTIIPCEHSICCDCLKEIVFSKRELRCPFDGRKIEFIIDYAEKENPKTYDIPSFKNMSFAIRETSLLKDF